VCGIPQVNAHSSVAFLNVKDRLPAQAKNILSFAV
jgi:hypothetical protein